MGLIRHNDNIFVENRTRVIEVNEFKQIPPDSLMDFASHFPSSRPALVLRNPSVFTGSGSSTSRGVQILSRSSDVGDPVVNQPKEKGIAASPRTRQNDDVRSSPKRVSAGNLVQAELGNPLPDANPKPSWSEVVTQDRGASRMKFSYHPPQIKDAKLVVCPPEEVIGAGVSKRADCVVGFNKITTRYVKRVDLANFGGLPLLQVQRVDE